MKKQVAIYGGAFNPPHLAHLFAIQYLLTLQRVDEVWVMPSAQHAFGKHMAPFDVRCSMLTELLRDYPRVKISRFEYEAKDLSGRTYDTLDTLSNHHLNCEFTLVIGADNITESHRWYRFDDLVKRWSLIILGRPGHESSIANLPKHMRYELGPTLPSISSSELRACLDGSHPSDEILRWLPQRCSHIAKTYYSHVTARSLQDTQHHQDIQTDVWVWGSGRAGRTLEYALKLAGYRTQITSLRQLKWIGENATHIPNTQFPLQSLKVKVWILACRDAQLMRCTDVLTHHIQAYHSQCSDMNTQVIFHCSGTLDETVLAPLQAQGLAIAQFHPLQSLRGPQSISDLRGAAFYVQGDTMAVQIAKQYVDQLGAWTFNFPEHAKTMKNPLALYHAAAVCAGNLPLLWIEYASLILSQLGMSKAQALRALTPLAHAGVNVLQHIKEFDQSQNDSTMMIYDQEVLLDEIIQKSVTGPLVRQDLLSIQKHISAMKDNQIAPDILKAYQSFVICAARILNWDHAQLAQLHTICDIKPY